MALYKQVITSLYNWILAMRSCPMRLTLAAEGAMKQVKACSTMLTWLWCADSEFHCWMNRWSVSCNTITTHLILSSALQEAWKTFLSLAHQSSIVFTQIPALNKTNTSIHHHGSTTAGRPSHIGNWVLAEHLLVACSFTKHKPYVHNITTLNMKYKDVWKNDAP
jgi:hypothetical protein